MSKTDQQELINLLRETLDKYKAHDEQHELEHAFIRKLMEEYNKRIEILDAIKKKIIVGSAWSVFMAIVASGLYGIKVWVSH